VEERHKAIGLLDSGVGGLTLVKELNQHLPGENIVYFGDTARMPYGPRRPEEVREFATEIIEFLAATQDLKLMIIACNTATAVGLKYYQSLFPFPVLGVLEPGARAALDRTSSGRIGVIGTDGTIASKAYPRTITEINPNVQVFKINNRTKSPADKALNLIGSASDFTPGRLPNISRPCGPGQHRVFSSNPALASPLHKGGNFLLHRGCTYYLGIAPLN